MPAGRDEREEGGVGVGDERTEVGVTRYAHSGESAMMVGSFVRIAFVENDAE